MYSKQLLAILLLVTVGGGNRLELQDLSHRAVLHPQYYFLLLPPDGRLVVEILYTFRAEQRCVGSHVERVQNAYIDYNTESTVQVRAGTKSTPQCDNTHSSYVVFKELLTILLLVTATRWHHH